MTIPLNGPEGPLLEWYRAVQSLNRLIDARLIRRALSLEGLNEAVMQRVSLPLANHCRVLNLSRSVLVMGVDASSWGTRLRFHERDILKVASQHSGMALSKLRIKVVPADQPPRRKTRRAHLSSASAQTIEASARALPAGPLREALLKLARHGNDRERS